MYRVFSKCIAHDFLEFLEIMKVKNGEKPMGGVFAKYSVQAVAWLFSKKSGLFFGISRFKKIDTVT